MKGAIFIALNEMIEEKYGMETWFELLDDAGLDGIYTSAETYPDSDAIKLVNAISEKLNIPTSKALQVFGEYLFDFLHRGFPIFADNQPNFFSFIESIEGVIHVEVNKLDSEAVTPHISVESKDERSAVVIYQSDRKLCHLAEGLLIGAAKHYNINVGVQHLVCMHDGENECKILVTQIS